jgi:hypothetical protein
MGFFKSEILGLREHGVIYDDASFGEAWEPPTPSYKAPASQTAALAHMMQINGTMMLQLSRSLAKGNIKGARVKLRGLFRRLDAALRQLETLEKNAKRRR